MKRPRVTIGGWMVLAAFAAINAALGRAYLVDREFFEGVLLIAVSFQVGLAGLILGRGRARRFWIGFEVAGGAAVLALIAAEVPGTAWNGWVGAYVNFAMNLAFAHLPEALNDYADENQDPLLAVVYFVPILLAAIAGGTFAALAVQPGGKAHPSTPDQSRS